MIHQAEPVILPTGEGLEEALEAVPAGPAVFAIWPRGGEPYLGRTAVLRRRVRRMMRTTLRTTAERIEFWPVGSNFEGGIVLYQVARRCFPDRYLAFLKLRLPYFVKLAHTNEFPRLVVTQKFDVTQRNNAEGGQFFGPFRSRASAELFEHEFLDLFQIRRCMEDLQPDPSHPGCIYGEMNMCLRPCQSVVGREEYRSEVARVSDFLITSGKAAHLQSSVIRDRLSDAMDFEGAAREHKRLEQIEKALSLRDELAVDIDRLYGAAVTPAAHPGNVLLWICWKGTWQQPHCLPVAEGNETLSLDVRLKAILASMTPEEAQLRERGEHIALLSRWYYSSWREGEWVSFEDAARPPYRRLVNAVSRVARTEVKGISRGPL